MTWKQFDILCPMLLEKVVGREKVYTSIVAISRGGVFLGAKMAIMMGIKNFYVVAYSSYSGHHREQLKQIYPLHQDLDRKTVLLIDDIADTGHTLLKAKQDLERRGCKVDTMTFHYKPDSKIIPDYSLFETREWVTYPWEDN